MRDDASVQDILHAMADLDPSEFEEFSERTEISVGERTLPLTGVIAALARMAVETQVESILDSTLPMGGLKAVPVGLVRTAIGQLLEGPFCSQCGYPSTAFEPVAPCSYCELLLCDDCAVGHDCPFDPNREPEDEADEEPEGEGDF